MRRLLTVTTLLSCTLLVPIAKAEAPFSLATTPGELPKTVIPTAYVIDLKTDLDHLTLQGTEHVTVRVARSTREITLNQAGLKLTAATLDTHHTATISEDEDAQTATLHFDHAVAPGTHHLAITYTGPILKTANGIYIDDYTTKAGKNRRMLVTQFEVADARRMFPCWDEPVFKATFQLNVTMPFDLTPVSNMPITHVTHSGTETKRVSFQTTPRMSTYLLALVAGDMKRVSGSAAGTPMNVYAPTGREEQGRYALSAAEKILPYYNDYFGVKYPLPKLDMIAIPGNYQAGAMENWGALTYIDNVLLYDPENSSAQTKELVHIVVAHEMAHQWSGDLVTMAWWNNIWLNEGFATWMEVKATARLNPEWELWPRQHATREETMATDALSSTHPVQQVIKGPSDADAAFDGISYGKGGAVIRMIENWLGPDHFRDGMRAYMKAHAYSSTTSQDLWNALSAKSGQNVGAVARSFTEQPGIPLVHVASRCDGDKTAYTLTQSRFSIHDPHAEPLEWSIPIVAGGPQLSDTRLVLSGAPQEMAVQGCHTPLKLNLGENGYYRVTYDNAAFSAIAQHVAEFNAEDRANLLGDSYALFQSGTDPLTRYFTLLDKLNTQPGGKSEQNIAVVDEMIAHLEELDHYEIGTPERATFESYATHILKPVFERLGWEAKAHEPMVDTLLRPHVIEALGRFNDPEVMQGLTKRFAAWQRNPSSLSPGLVSVVTGIAVRNDVPGSYAAVTDRIRHSHRMEEQIALSQALSMARGEDQIRQSIDFALGGVIPNGRVGRFIAAVAADSENPDFVWQVVKGKLAELRPRLTPAANDKLLPSIVSHTTTPATITALQNEPTSGATPGARIATNQALDDATKRIEMTKRVHTAIATWDQARHR